MKKCECGNETNEKDGKCVVCKVDKKVNDLANIALKSQQNKDSVNKKFCKYPGCKKVVYRQGMCMLHLKQTMKHNGVDIPPEEHKPSTTAGCDCSCNQPADFFTWLNAGIANNYFIKVKELKDKLQSI